jgi:electron transfer flavoprotein beta subunit
VRVAVCLKWVDTRPEIDPVSGRVIDDERWFSASPADQTALEVALEMVDERGGDVMVVCAGPPGAEPMLRGALAAGAATAVRVDLDPALDADAVAEAVAPVVAEADVVCCGTWSLDRGTGSFPAFLAHRLGAAQALGCTSVVVADSGLTASRRLDGGRREVVHVDAPAVVSVEAGAELRRASLRSVLDSADMAVDVVVPDPARPSSTSLERTGPYRPRSRELAPPAGGDVRERLLSLTGALVDEAPSMALHVDPEAAADHLLAALGERGIGPEASEEE